MLKRIATVLAIWLIVLGICCSVSQAEGTYEFPDGVTVIDDYAFYGSTSVKEVVLPEGLLRLGVQCFAYSGLMQVTLPDTLEFIADDAFEGCSALTVSATEGTYAYEWAVDNGYVQVDMPEPSPIEDFKYKIANGQATITDYIGSDVYVVIPRYIEGCPVTYIGYGAFQDCRNIVSLYVPNSVKTIAAYAFASCTNLTSITLPNSVTTIESGHAFYNCSNLTSIALPNRLTSIPYTTFSYCTALTSITIPGSVKTIGEGAFERCNNLTRVILEDGVTTIGVSAFHTCTNLSYISIPNSVTSIEKWAFESCSNLPSITIPSSVTRIGDSAFSYCRSLTNVTIENGVTNISWGAFSDCTNLTSLLIPNSVTNIGDYAFSKCSGLLNITIPGSVTRIGEATFSRCSSLTNVIIENGVSSIDREAFYECTSLTSISIPSSVKSIGTWSFVGCSKLPSITIPGSVATIGESPFVRCTSLASVIIENGVTSIGWKAFGECSSLKSITIPASVVRIDDYAFTNCTSLTDVTIEKGLTRIGGYIFDGCISLTSISIPDSVTSIGIYAFNNCKNLTNLKIPNSVTSIGNHAFLRCANMTNIIIPGSVASIGEGAFLYCNNLASVTLENGVISIERRAFEGCTSLNSISIPDSVVRIDNTAFTNSPNVTICTSYGSTAHKYAQSKNIPCIFYNTTTPGVTPETAPDAYLYYKIHHTFSIDGATYYEAELLKAYNGVAPSDDYAIRTFYMDAQQHVVTDASVLCKLYTLSMYVNGEASINSLLSTWKTTSQTCSSTATKFLTDKQLFNSLGAAAGDVVNALTIKSVTWLAGIKDLVNTLTDAGQAEAILLMVDIKNYSSHLSEMTDYTSNIPVCINGGAYDYDLVNIKLQYYAYCRTCYKLVQGMCMPVIDKITQNYASSWDLAFDHLTTFCFSFAETFVPSINEGLAWTGPAIKGIGMVVQNDFSATNILSELFSVASVTVKDYVWKDVDSIATITDLASGLLNIVTGSVANLCNFHGMDQSEYDAFKAPYYVTTEEMRDTTLYKNHQLLAQPLS